MPKKDLYFSGAGAGGAGGATAPPKKKKFADQLSLLEPGRADFPHLLPLAPQCFSPTGITAKDLFSLLWFLIKKAGY